MIIKYKIYYNYKLFKIISKLNIYLIFQKLDNKLYNLSNIINIALK